MSNTNTDHSTRTFHRYEIDISTPARSIRHFFAKLIKIPIETPNVNIEYHNPSTVGPSLATSKAPDDSTLVVHVESKGSVSFIIFTQCWRTESGEAPPMLSRVGGWVALPPPGLNQTKFTCNLSSIRSYPSINQARVSYHRHGEQYRRVSTWWLVTDGIFCMVYCVVFQWILYIFFSFWNLLDFPIYYEKNFL